MRVNIKYLSLIVFALPILTVIITYVILELLLVYSAILFDYFLLLETQHSTKTTPEPRFPKSFSF